MRYQKLVVSVHKICIVSHPNDLPVVVSIKPLSMIAWVAVSQSIVKCYIPVQQKLNCNPCKKSFWCADDLVTLVQWNHEHGQKVLYKKKIVHYIKTLNRSDDLGKKNRFVGTTVPVITKKQNYVSILLLGFCNTGTRNRQAQPTIYCLRLAF